MAKVIVSVLCVCLSVHWGGPHTESLHPYRAQALTIPLYIFLNLDLIAQEHTLDMFELVHCEVYTVSRRVI